MYPPLDSYVPWEKFIRATSIPPESIFTNISTSPLEGPIVATICDFDDMVFRAYPAMELIVSRRLYFTTLSGFRRDPVLRPKQPNRSEERRVGKECRSRWS